jgi:LacI family transcriptional regulator
MAGSVTIDDVAAQAGVSIKTVSRVVNKEPNVREKTRDKVLEAIKALNYRPNQSARGLAGRRSYLIGLLYDNPSPNYLANLQAGVLAACQEVSYGLALSPVAYGDPETIENIIAWMRQSAIDGVLLTPPLSDSKELVSAIKAEGVPAVVVSSVGPGGVPAVVIDEKEAARQMTRHLIAAGHSKIAFIKGHPDHYASTHRFDGFKAAMGEAGLAIDENMVKQGYFDFDSGKVAGEALLKGKSRPTAVFASNDDMAAGVMHIAHRMKLEIPTDLAVVGFDDTPLSRQVWPNLSTVRQPIRMMGHVAGELLLQSIGGESRKKIDPDTFKQLDFEMKERGSSTLNAD